MEKIFKTLSENRDLPMTDQQLSDLGVDLHPLDIRTGETSQSATSYFLPRLDFPDVVDSPDLAKSPLMEFGSASEVPGSRPNILFDLAALQDCMFPDAMTDEYKYFAFERDRDIKKQFYGHQISLGGWHTDRIIDSPFEYAFLGPSGRKYEGFESTLSTTLEDPLDSASCHSHKSHRTSLVQLLTQAKCGSNERPSSIELYALAALTEREIAEINGRTWRCRTPPKNPNIPNECYFMFPQLVTLIDQFGGCRILQSYYDGRLHIQFTEVLNLGHMVAVPDRGQKYFDLVDRKDYLEKLNMLLKWAWPIAQGNTIAKTPRPC